MILVSNLQVDLLSRVARKHVFGVSDWSDTSTEDKLDILDL